MINAEEARMITEKYVRTKSEKELPQTIIRIDAEIKDAASKGQILTCVNLPVELMSEHRNIIINQLEAAGYNVKFKFINGHIPQLEINWLEANNENGCEVFRN